jgi:hypothetical protein
MWDELGDWDTVAGDHDPLASFGKPNQLREPRLGLVHVHLNHLAKDS